MKDTIHHSILLTIGCFFLCINSHAQNADINLLNSINPNQTPTSVFWKASSNSTYPLCIGIPATLLAASFVRPSSTLRQQSLYMIEVLAINTITTQSLKRIIRRQRPYQQYPTTIFPNNIENDYSFPSGHTSSAFALATTICIENKKWYLTVPAFAWATSVGYSRMYLGEHYPTDVLAGAALGIASAYLTNWINKKIYNKINKHD